MASRQPHRGASPGPMLRSALVTQARETPRRRAKAARVSPPAAIASAYLRARIRARSLVGTFVACGGRTSTMAIFAYFQVREIERLGSKCSKSLGFGERPTREGRKNPFRCGGSRWAGEGARFSTEAARAAGSGRTRPA
jgi:hypothetical protein